MPMNRLRLIALIPLAFLLIFFCYPLIQIARESFTVSDISQGRGLLAVFGDASYLRIAGFSLEQAALSTTLTLLTGLPAGTRSEVGVFTAGSVNARVEDRLRAFASVRRSFAGGHDNDTPRA